MSRELRVPPASDDTSDPPPNIIVEFVALSADLAPDALGQALGVTPTRVWRKGEPSGPTGVGTWPTNGIAVTVSPSPSASPDEQLQAISRLIGRRAARIRDLVLDGSASADVWISISGPSDAFGFTFTPSSLRFLADVGANLQVDAYALDRDDPS